MKLELKIANRITFSLPTVQNSLSPEQFEALKTFLNAELRIENPEFAKSARFLKGRSGRARAPRHLNFWHIRKPRTDPSFEVPLGFLQPLSEFLRALGLELIPRVELVSQPIQVLSTIELRAYQRQAVDALTRRHRGILVAPCGAGKTVMALELLARRSQKTLVLVHTLDLMRQWVESCQELLGVCPSCIGGGQKDQEGDIVIATVQTLVRNRALITRLASQVGTVLVDECHHTPASTFTKVLGLLKPTYLYGVSATPNREDGLSPVMHLFLGPILHTIQTRSLQEENHLLRPALEAVPTNFFYPYDSEDPESWHRLMEALIQDEERNSLIASRVLKQQPASCMVLSTRIEHLELLLTRLQDLEPRLRAAILTGKTPREQREATLEAVRQGDIQVLLATQLADEGLDIRCLQHVFLAAPTRNRSRVEQRIGRVMRTLQGKTSACVHDFVDRSTKVLHSQYNSRYHTVYKRVLDVNGAIS